MSSKKRKCHFSIWLTWRATAFFIVARSCHTSLLPLSQSSTKSCVVMQNHHIPQALLPLVKTSPLAAATFLISSPPMDWSPSWSQSDSIQAWKLSCYLSVVVVGLSSPRLLSARIQSQLCVFLMVLFPAPLFRVEPLCAKPRLSWDFSLSLDCQCLIPDVSQLPSLSFGLFSPLCFLFPSSLWFLFIYPLNYCSLLPMWVV